MAHCERVHLSYIDYSLAIKDCQVVLILPARKHPIAYFMHSHFIIKLHQKCSCLDDTMSKTISRESDTHLMVSFVIYMAFLKWEAVSFVGCQLFSLTTFFL